MKTIKSILSIQTEWVEKESFSPDADKIISGQPTQNVWNAYSSSDEKFSAGIWDAQAGEWKVHYTEDEFCIILEGESVITDKNGDQKTVKAGDRFVMPAGFQGTWQVASYCKKIYVVY